MRCPKCGYISFDRQRSCGKCSNDLTAVAEQLQGTAGKAAAPFFLGAVLGKSQSNDVESGPALQEEEVFALDELEAEAPAADEEDLDFAGAPQDEDDQEDHPLPSLGLEDIDVSDLVPPQEEEEETVLSLGSEQEEAILEPPPARGDEEDSLMGEIEFSSLESGDVLNVDEKASPLGHLEYGTAKPVPEAEDEEIIDLSSLMNFDETPASSADKEEDHDTLELSLGDAPDEQHLSLEDEEKTPAPAETPKKSASAVTDIPDLGLTLENDDQ